jgi:hypothetical protein
MNDHNTSLVNLSIPKEVTQPIVAAKIQEAVLAALGGSEKIIEGVINKICYTMVNPNDGKVSGYSSENKVSWLDFHVTSIIQNAVKEELKKQLENGALPVKEALIKTMQSKAGSNKIADAILSGLTDGFNSKDFKPKVTIEFNKTTNRDW